MSQATVEDAPGLAAILFEEFLEQHPWTRVRFSAMVPEDRRAYLEECLHEDLTNPERPLVIQKMEDDETGEIVAFLQLNDCNVPANVRQHVDPIVKPAGYNVAPIRDHYAKMMAAQRRAMGEETFMREYSFLRMRK
jgi:hypothetical protein